MAELGEASATVDEIAAHAAYGLSTDAAVLDAVPLERLEAEISGFASRLAAATATWLLWVGAYDRREGWASWEAKSCAHWLNWHCGMSPRSAREHVSVAHKLEEFGLMRETFLSGQLSYSKVRAMCRVIEPANEAELVEIAQMTTASQLERIVGKMPPPGAEGDVQSVAPIEVSFRENHDGTTSIIMTIPTEEAAIARAGLNATVSSAIERESVGGESRSDVVERLGGIGRLRADTAVGLLSGRIGLAHEPEAEVLVVADIDVLTGLDDAGECTVDNRRIAPEVARRLCCDAIVEAAALGNDGQPLGIGRRSRVVPRRLRRLVLRRDHGICQFPGCESDRRLHAHHVIHWAFGGPTDLDNLISLCHFHHSSVHDGGWNITSSSGGWIFRDVAGVEYQVPVLRLPTRAPIPHPNNGTAVPRDDRGGLVSTAPNQALKASGERCDVHYVADVLVANTQARRA